MALHFKLDTFEGPLDLLLHLVNKEEVDIREVSITKIADQFLRVLQEAKHLELDVASEFLVMAATLVSIKSKSLLPKIEPNDSDESIDDEDLQAQLIDKLVEYSQFKQLANALGEYEIERNKIYSPLPYDLISGLEEIDHLSGVSLDKLFNIFQEIIDNKESIVVPTMVEREKISVSDCMDEIIGKIKCSSHLSFRSLFHKHSISREYIISTFLAVLELIKVCKIRCVQDNLFDDIKLEACGEMIDAEVLV